MRKFVTILFIFIVLTTSFVPVSYTSAEDAGDYFIVTAYYSPLPDQKYYITGNYEDEKILNGQGIAGASGKKVFSGMLAAPGKYAFGTKIYLDGLGVAVVEDRGGAIVEAGNRGYQHDRIDVWVGHGDEGLRRALFWGKRKVYGHITKSSEKISLDYTKIPDPMWVTKNLKKASQKPLVNIFNTSVNSYSETFLIQELQKAFSEVGYLDSELISGKYDAATIDAVYNFQIKHDIVTGEYSQGAGSYGPKTRKKFHDIYNLYLEEKEKKEALLAQITKLQESSKEKADNLVKNLNSPSYGEISPQVRELQKALAELGYFEYKDTAIFGVKTQDAIMRYQISKGIIQDESDSGAGVFGPQTQKNFGEDIAEKYFRVALEENDLLASYQEYYKKDNISSETNVNSESSKVFKI